MNCSEKYEEEGCKKIKRGKALRSAANEDQFPEGRRTLVPQHQLSANYTDESRRDAITARRSICVCFAFGLVYQNTREIPRDRLERTDK